jgi:hypothetical protein
MTTHSDTAKSSTQSSNQAPNPPSAAEPQPKPGADAKDAPPRPSPAPRKVSNGEVVSPQVAPVPPDDMPVNPDQSDG